MNIYVKLTASKNTYLTYPCYGLLHIHEMNIYGGVMHASFRVAQDGQLSAPVQVAVPKFQYTPRIAKKGAAIVFELAQRQGRGLGEHVQS